MTSPTKVPSDSLGRIGRLKRTSDKSLFPMASGSCGHRITHQLRPINMNGRSILSVTSVMVRFTSGVQSNTIRFLGKTGFFGLPEVPGSTAFWDQALLIHSTLTGQLFL